MPLSPPAERAPIHAREIRCQGYLRADGLWDVEGRLTDRKAHPFTYGNLGRLEPGAPVHDMWLRLTVDDALVIHGVEAATDASPYAICPEVVPNFKAVEGLTIGPGWNREVRRLVGGVAGCTHLVELLGRLGTVCYQTIHPYRRQSDPDGDRTLARRLIDSCHAWRADGPVIAEHLPERDAAPD